MTIGKEVNGWRILYEILGFPINQAAQERIVADDACSQNNEK